MLATHSSPSYTLAARSESTSSKFHCTSRYRGGSDHPSVYYRSPIRLVTTDHAPASFLLPSSNIFNITSRPSPVLSLQKHTRHIPEFQLEDRIVRCAPTTHGQCGSTCKCFQEGQMHEYILYVPWPLRGSPSLLHKSSAEPTTIFTSVNEL